MLFDVVNLQTIAVTRRPSRGSQVMPAIHYNDKGDFWEGDLLYFHPDLHIHVFLSVVIITWVLVLDLKNGESILAPEFPGGSND